MENKNYVVSESCQFTFYQVPKQLFTDERFANLSTDAKLLYGILLDRMSLSVRNGWYDENEEVYLYFTVKQVEELLHFSHEKVGRLYAELERFRMIERKRQGQGKATRIYVKRFTTDIRKTDFKTSENRKSGNPKSRSQDICFSDASNTNKNHTEMSDTDLSIQRYDMDEMEERIKEQIEYDILAESESMEQLNEIVFLICDVICGTLPMVRIGGNDYPRESVRSRLFKLESEHIQYVIDQMDKNTTKVRNIRAYLLAALYNATTTMDHYYQAEVNHDLYG